MSEIRNGYVAMKGTGSKKPNSSPATYRDWWLVKYMSKERARPIKLGTVNIPKEYIGQRIRFKVELVEDGPDLSMCSMCQKAKVRHKTLMMCEACAAYKRRNAKKKERTCRMCMINVCNGPTCFACRIKIGGQR